MTKIISFANQKGGVGKSTLCLQSAFYLVEAKKRVLVLDFDPQGNTSSRLSQDAERNAIKFTGLTTAELFSVGLPRTEVMHCPRGMDLIWTTKNDPELSEIESMNLDCSLRPAENLRNSGLLEKYDYVLIDCPPSLGRKLVAALVLSTHVVSPVQVSGFAVDGLEGLLNTVISVQSDLNPELENTGIVINNLNRNFQTHMEARQELIDAVPDLVYKAEIGVRGKLDEATNRGVPVWSIKSTSGRAAAKDVRAVIKELLKKVG